jgi:hypothetical protein
MTLQQFSVYRSLQSLHPEYITEDFLQPDGKILIIQYKEEQISNKIVRLIEVDHYGGCSVTSFDDNGRKIVRDVPRPEKKSFKSRHKVEK